VLSLDTDVYNLAYDATTNSLWFAQMRGVEPDYLYRVDAATHESTRWLLPETLHNGFLTEVDVGDDGGVWITYEYLLLRFDPVTETVASHRFPVVQPQADRVGGTWISGIGVEGGSVWVVRNGLGLVVLVDAEMKEVQEVQLPEAWTFAEDVGSLDGRLFVARSGRDDGQGPVEPGGVGVFSLAGEELAFGELQGGRIQVVEGRVLAYADDTRGGATAWIAPDGNVELVDPGTFDFAATALSASAAITYINPLGGDPARLLRHQDGTAQEIAVFEKRLVESDVCHGPLTIPSQSTVPSCPPMWTGAPRIDAIVTDAASGIWYFENFSGRASILWTIPT
jgi:hypothetical protein